MIRTRHEFLAVLHEAFKPTTYLEIGVQFGHSLRLTLPPTQAARADPNPLCTPPPNAEIYPFTSDEFFRLGIGEREFATQRVDFAFIDGMHLIENVLRDFTNCEEVAAPGGLIAIDDVLPYSPDIAGRTPLPGDWAGDVWKLWPILTKWRPKLKITMVDVEPTGLMIIQDLDPSDGPQLLRGFYDQIVATWATEYPLDQWVSDGNMRGRVGTLTPEQALHEIGA